MANFTLPQLLKYDPFVALLIAYNDIHGTSLNPRYVELLDVQETVGRDVQVRIKSIETIPNTEERRFNGIGSIRVERLDLNEMFNEGFKIRHHGEIVSRDVARTITQITGIVFDSNDFIDEVITDENPRLKASPRSLRWHGSILIERIFDDFIPLADVLDEVVVLEEPSIVRNLHLADVLLPPLSLSLPE